MIHDHLRGFYGQVILLEPLEQVSIRSAADIKEQTFNVVQLMIIARLVVDIVAQILQIFHSSATGLRNAGENKSINYFR